MKTFAALSLILRGPMTRLPSRLLIGPPGVAKATMAPRVPTVAPLRFYSTPQLSNAETHQLRNETITAPLVRLVDPVTGQLNGPFSPADILAKVNQREYVLVQVTSGDLGTEKEWTVEQLPICRLVSKHEEYQKLRNAKKRPKTSTKEMQFSWVVGEHDMMHKVTKVHQELERGHKVHVSIVGKRGYRRARPGTTEYSRRTEVFDRIINETCSRDGRVVGIVHNPPKWHFQRSQVEYVVEPHNS